MGRTWCRSSEAARILGVSTSTIRRLIQHGELEARRWDGGWYQVASADVERLARLMRSCVPDDDPGD
jgi:excisionase family DNA binding protein